MGNDSENPYMVRSLLPEPCLALIRTVVERYLRLRLEAKFDRPQAVRLARESLRRFIHWLGAEHPDIDTLSGKPLFAPRHTAGSHPAVPALSRIGSGRRGHQRARGSAPKGSAAVGPVVRHRDDHQEK